MSGTQFYKRKYKLSIQTYGGRTITLSENIQFSFSIDKKAIRMYQFGEVTIRNLSPATETEILKNGASVTLECGYVDGPYGQVFKGPIRQAIRGKESDSVTYFLRLICIDGDDALNLGICNFTIGNGQTLRQVAEMVARSSSTPFEIQVGQDFQSNDRLARSKTVYGKPGDTLRSIALDNDSFFFFDDGVANIMPLNSQPPARAINLNAQSGMIGMPSQTDQGVKIKALINPGIKLGGWVQLDNKSVITNQLQLGVPQTLLDLDGLYRIVGILATGDTRGQDWYYEMETVSQAGLIPAMMASPSNSGVQ